jgi:hypothetical protein
MQQNHSTELSTPDRVAPSRAQARGLETTSGLWLTRVPRFGRRGTRRLAPTEAQTEPPWRLHHEHAKQMQISIMGQRQAPRRSRRTNAVTLTVESLGGRPDAARGQDGNRAGEAHCGRRDREQLRREPAQNRHKSVMSTVSTQRLTSSPVVLPSPTPRIMSVLPAFASRLPCHWSSIAARICGSGACQERSRRTQTLRQR